MKARQLCLQQKLCSRNLCSAVAAVSGYADSSDFSDLEMVPSLSLTAPWRPLAPAQARGDSDADCPAAAAVSGADDSSEFSDMDHIPRLSLTVPQRQLATSQAWAASGTESCGSESEPDSSRAGPSQKPPRIPACRPPGSDH